MFNESYTEDDKISDIYWFSGQSDMLLKENGIKFYAIRNKEILGIYDTYDEALEDVTKLNLLGNCIIQKSEKSPTGYTKQLLSVWF